MTKNMKVEVSIEVFLNNVTSVDDNTSKSELYASYRLAWFIINIGSSDGYKKRATDQITINEDGLVFDKVDRLAFPIPDLHKKLKLKLKLKFIMSGDGNFIFKGPLGLFDLVCRSAQTTIFGNIHQKVGLGI